MKWICNYIFKKQQQPRIRKKVIKQGIVVKGIKLWNDLYKEANQGHKSHWSVIIMKW